MSEQPIVSPSPSATVILIRNSGDHLETLLLRRNSKLAFHGGAWVFPGGRIDPEDYPQLAPHDQLAAARQAAVREAQEEAGLAITSNELVWFAHWTTPVTNPRRFATWFFIATGSDDEVQIDGGEIHDHQWTQPSEALAAQRAGEIELPPPTFVTLLQLDAYRTAPDALAAFAARPHDVFTPRNQKVPGGVLSLYEEDAGYESGDYDLSGPRHRLWMIDSGWRYEQDI